MHGVIAAQRQFRNDSLRSTGGNDCICRQRITDNTIADLCVHGSFVDTNATATGSSCLLRLAESLDHICFPSTGLVAQGDEKSAFMNLVEVVIVARPRVRVDDSIRPHCQVASMTDTVRKNG